MNTQENDAITSELIKIYTCFKVVGDNLDPVNVTKLTGITCDSSTTKGQPSLKKQSYGIIATKGAWTITSKHQIKSMNLEQHFQYLFDRLNNLEAIFSKLKQEGNEIYFSCTWFYPYTYEGPTLSRKTLSKIVLLSAEIEFEYYFTG